MDINDYLQTDEAKQNEKSWDNSYPTEEELLEEAPDYDDEEHEDEEY